MKQMPKIEKYMTPMPYTIGAYIPIKTAVNVMREFRIRHLPVEDAGKLVGILTDRDIKLAASFDHAEEFNVEDVMTPDPYTVTPESPLDRIVFEMAEHKYGCAVIRQENGKVVGIFTATDALRVLGEILANHYKSVG
jgi:acetoin utilization protein AcuB